MTLPPVLVIHPDNPRYFMVQGDPEEKAVYLTGSHVWENLQSYNPGYACGPDAPFWESYLTLLESNGHNFIRGWTWEDDYYSPPLYDVVAGSYDLDTVAPDYLACLTRRVSEAQARGLYISIMLFEGFSVFGTSNYRSPEPWSAHPFHAANNGSGIDGDTNHDGSGSEVHTLVDPAVTAKQKMYVDQVIDALNAFDNVIWEVANEPNPAAGAWQEEMAQYIQSVESQHCAKRHLVWVSPHWGSNPNPYSGAANVISLGLNYPGMPGSPPPAKEEKPVLLDTDHLDFYGYSHDYSWVWKSFTRGYHPILMDPLHDVTWDPYPPSDPAFNPGAPEFATARPAMGRTLEYAQRMDLAAMVPQCDPLQDCDPVTPSTTPGWSSTGYALLGTREYVTYKPQTGSGSINVYLPPGDYQFEWFNAATNGSAQQGSLVDHPGGYAQFQLNGPSVLYIERPELHFDRQPEDVEVLIEKEADFSVEASGGVGTLYYRWEKWVGGAVPWASVVDAPGHVSGSNTDRLSFDYTEPSDEGSYRCIVTDSDSPPARVESAIATLTLIPPV